MRLSFEGGDGVGEEWLPSKTSICGSVLRVEMVVVLKRSNCPWKQAAYAHFRGWWWWWCWWGATTLKKAHTPLGFESGDGGSVKMVANEGELRMSGEEGLPLLLASKWRQMSANEWRRWSNLQRRQMSGERGQPLLSPPVMAVVNTYIKKEHVGTPFAPALLSSLSYDSYLVGWCDGNDGGGIVLCHCQVERPPMWLVIWQGYGDNL